VLKAETKKRIAERMPANTHFMTGLATSNLIGASELAKSLEQRKVELASDLEALKDKQFTIENIPQSARRLLELGETLLEAELRWINIELERTKQ
jgi:hypothetical protein